MSKKKLNVISHLLSRIPYEPLERPKVDLPERQPRGDYVEADLPLHFVPELF